MSKEEEISVHNPVKLKIVGKQDTGRELQSAAVIIGNQLEEYLAVSVRCLGFSPTVSNEMYQVEQNESDFMYARI